jgi:muconolactone delta-isomerase
MEFLVEFDLKIPAGSLESEIKDREKAEASAAAKLADDGNLIRLWKLPVAGGTTPLGLYRADSRAQLEGLLRALPLYDWMQVTVTPLEPHPNDPAAPEATT